MKDLGMRIKATRALLNMSSAELARQSKLSAAAISRYENNLRFPSYQALMRMSVALGVSVNYLAGDEIDYLAGNERDCDA